MSGGDHNGTQTSELTERMHDVRKAKPQKRKAHTFIKYLCYTCRRMSDGNYHATNMCWPMLADAPRTFTWRGDDPEGLRGYIDFLVQRRAEAKVLEASGQVQDIVVDPMPEGELIDISLHDLIRILLMRTKIDLPVSAVVNLIPVSWGVDRAVMYRRFGAALALLNREIEGVASTRMRPNNAEIRAHRRMTSACRRHEPIVPGKLVSLPRFEEGDENLLLEAVDKVKEDIAAEDRHTTYSEPLLKNVAPTALERMAEEGPLVTAPEESAVMSDSGAGAASEAEIYRRPNGKAFELMTRVRDGDKQYFARRVFDARGMPLYVATALSSGGPWHVWERDNALMLALHVQV